MIPRYTRPEMGRIFGDENRFAQWLAVELAASEALAETGEVPAADARALRQHASFEVARIHEIEREVKHDVIAFTTAVAEKMAAAGHADSSRWMHYGLTSNDVVDTAQALVLKQASAQIRAGMIALLDVLKRRAHEFKHTVQIGRTHGIHAEPITFGLKLALWYDEMQRNLLRFDAAAEDLRVGKISGVVGAFGHIGPEAEEKICERLGLRPAPIASQVIARDRHAAWVSALALLGATLEKDIAGDSASAAHGGSRGRGAVQRRAKGLVRDAAQAESGNGGADLRIGAHHSRKRDRGDRRCRPVART